MTDALPYRDFYYPLNVFMHILTAEEGSVPYLHYGLFERDDEPIAVAQERSTDLLLSRLPPPPAALLEVGIGLGTTLDRLTRLGYDVEGITPDVQQIDMVRARFGDGVRATCAAFESFKPGRTFDAIVFQESSQYIASDALFAKAGQLAQRVIVIDEFALRDEGTLHRLDAFLNAAARHRFTVDGQLDLSQQAAPTIDYFMNRLERYREPLMRELSLTSQQVDDLIESGRTYRESYRNGVYGYLFLSLRHVD
jgi:SAM-dependent methyltransferase